MLTLTNFQTNFTLALLLADVLLFYGRYVSVITSRLFHVHFSVYSTHHVLAAVQKAFVSLLTGRRRPRVRTTLLTMGSSNYDQGDYCNAHTVSDVFYCA